MRSAAAALPRAAASAPARSAAAAAAAAALVALGASYRPAAATSDDRRRRLRDGGRARPPTGPSPPPRVPPPPPPPPPPRPRPPAVPPGGGRSPGAVVPPPAPSAAAASAVLATSAPIPAASTAAASAVAVAPEEFDFVVVGNGRAGSSAVRTLRAACPGASVAVVDPFLPPPSARGGGREVTRRYPLAASGLDPSARTVLLSDGSHVRYRHSVLLATGSRGAPPPDELVDGGALGRVLELRTTRAPPPAAGGGGAPRTGPGGPRRPAMPPDGVRRLALMAASQGARVCVLGGGLEATELAAAAASASSRGEAEGGARRLASEEKDGGGDGSGGPKAALVFGSAAPLSDRLPRYLSAAVSKRLRRHGIDVQERSLIRYVAMHDHHLKPNELPYLEMHTARSFDTMDTKRLKADLLVVAPSVDGQRGTAVLPAPPSIADPPRVPFRAWSDLTPPSHPLLTCYVDDGRIAVNAELGAASGVYAAGSAARYPDPLTGHASVAGGGTAGGGTSGRVAATNMAREYRERAGRRGGVAGEEGGGTAAPPLPPPRAFASESFPMWRTDVCPYASSNSAGEGRSPLSSLGVHALCLGKCDSETMSTHGYWWTNRSSDRKAAAAALQSSTDEEEGGGGVLGRRRSTRRSSTLRRAVYGSGVVFYLDRRGSIRGVMLWGLPFARRDGADLNADLAGRMGDVIRTNGEVCKLRHAAAVEEQTGGAHNTDVLTSVHLAEESKLLASMALSDARTALTEMGSNASNMARPLHRFTPAKPTSITSVGVLRRGGADTGTGGIGEDIFVSRDAAFGGDAERPQSLVYVYPMDLGAGPGFGNGNSGTDGIHPLEEDEWHSSRSGPTPTEDRTRSRPPKEEPLWLRRGEAGRSVSASDILADAFFHNIRRGRFFDGTESVQQAPVPQAYQDSREKLREWTPAGEEEGGVKEER